jgi:hypothetical protein
MFENGDPLALALEAAETAAGIESPHHRRQACQKELAYSITINFSFLGIAQLTSTSSSSACCSQE